MKTNIFVPQKIKVGFQNRENTYTKTLAYVTYYDVKGKVRKETSWENWRDKKIDPVDHENIPTSGFVLNKKVGDYVSDWNHRQAYVRVYDPRGFEFEITIENLLYILENANSIKGKGLEGEFIYGWDGKDLVLLPVESPDYKEISKYNNILHEKSYIKSKELIIGATYRTKDNREFVYMGRFEYWDTKWVSPEDVRQSSYTVNVNKGKQYIFAKKTINYRKKEDLYLLNIKSLGDRIIEVITEECTDDYAEMFDLLEKSSHYSPYDESKDEYIIYDKNRFIDKVKEKEGAWFYGTSVYIENHKDGMAEVKRENRESENYVIATKTRVPSRWGSGYETKENILYRGTLEEIWNKFQARYRNKYLTNGKLHENGDEN
ncbi:hypothetical protein HUB98_05600 [Paenibacillus barcinonensis]|uniref:DKNYY family protein n=1 Tax=Paenibacillus barcinonensis TaxID=198119 RepID=A0ABX6QDC4_PAEBA|nr:hypothetical protein HUB98_05600 [Paenibacillus barcinonensis]